MPDGLHEKTFSLTLVKNRRKQAYGYFVSYRHWLCDLQTLEKFSSRTHISTKSVWTDILCFFNAQICLFGDKIIAWYVFCSYLDFFVSFRSCVDKMSKSHANDNWILGTWFCFKLVVLDSHPAKVHPFTQKIRKITLQHAPENEKVSVLLEVTKCIT